MTRPEATPVANAAALRRAFDQGFCEAPTPETAFRVDLLTLRVAGDLHGVRLAEISGLFTRRKIVGLPGSVPELLGIAGFRGALVPVLDLAMLLGYAAAPAPAWLLLAGKPPVALAFEAFEGQVRVAGSGLVPHGPGERERPHVGELVSDGRRVYPLLDLTSILAAVALRARSCLPRKEP